MNFPGVAVFVQEGCGACDEYLPRFARVSLPYRARGLAVRKVDIARFPEAAQQFRVNATPTTVVFTQRGPYRVVGAIDDNAIAQLLARVL